MTGPLIRMVFRQASRIRRQAAIIDQQQHAIETLSARLRRLYADVELLGACIAPEKRHLALSLVRDRHRIEDLDQTEVAGG
jgi:hypothetical protein